MSSSAKNNYWIPHVDINRKVIVSEIQKYLGPDSTVRPYTQDGEDGFLITTPGNCLTDEQIDDICKQSKEVWEKQAAARASKDSSKHLKRPLHQPVLVGRNSKPESKHHHHRRHHDERGEGSRRRSDERRHGESSRW